MFAKYTMGKKLVPRVFEEFLHINNEKNLVLELAKAFPKRESTDGYKHVENVQHHSNDTNVN